MLISLFIPIVCQLSTVNWLRISFRRQYSFTRKPFSLSTMSGGEFFCQTHDDCTVDLMNFIINCAFIVACFCTILWKISRKLSLLSTEKGTRFQEHNSRWILFIVLFLICFCEIGDAFIVTSSTRLSSHSLKIPAVFSLLAASTAAYFYSKMERWNQLKPMFIPLIYWPVIIASKIFKLGFLLHSGLGGQHLAVTITLCYLVVYVLSFLVEINLIWTNKYLSSWQSIALPLNDPPDTQYRRPWVSLPSKATFYWMNALIWRALKRPITQQCLGSLAQECQVQGHFNKFKEIYCAQSDKNPSPSLWKSFLILLWRPVLLGALLKFISDIISLIAPLAVGIIVSFVVDKSTHHQSSIKESNHVTVRDFLQNGYVTAIIVLLSTTTHSIFTHNLIHLMSRVAIRARCLVQMLVYEKSFKLSVWPKETRVADADEIRCLVTDDADNLMQFLVVLHHIWSFLFKLIILTVLVYLQLGYGAFIAIFVSVAFLLPAQYQLRRIMEKSQNDAQTIKSRRLCKMEEMLLKMLCLKMNSWEMFFAHKIRHIRQQESRLLLLISLCWWLHDALTWTALVLMSVVAFSVYTSAEREILTPQAAFTAVALFQQILFGLFLTPVLISVPINAFASLKRLHCFLSTSETRDKKFQDLAPEDSTVLEFEEDSGSVVLRIKDEFTNERPERFRDTEIFLNDSDEEVTGDVDAAIQLDEATFSWDPNNKEPVLKDLTLNIPIGKITLVCGQNRKAERAFVMSLLGELHTVNGSITWTRNSPIAFVSLIPWLQKTSIKDNILFGVPYDAQRYNRIVEACGLQGEFDQWPSGDQSLIDDIELSLSQKHCISIARALYSKCKIIILDDVFATMDPVLSLHVFEEGFKKLALQYHRTVIAVSRQTHILLMSDLVLVLKDQTLEFQGNWRQFQDWDPDMKVTSRTDDEPLNEDDELLNAEINSLQTKTIQNPAIKICNRGILQMLGIHIDKSSPKTISDANSTIASEKNTSELKDESSIELDDSRAPVVKPESSKEPIVPILKSLANKCFYHCGWMFLLSLVILFLATQTLLVCKDIWLSKWSNDWNKHGEDEYSGHYLTAYNVLCILGVINLGALSVVATVASTRAYNSIYNSIVDTAISFNNFTTAKIHHLMTALRIHFAQLDESIPIFYHYFWLGLLCLIIMFISFGVTLFMFLLLLLFAMFTYVFQRLYNKFYRNINELLSVSIDRVNSHLTETLKGLVLIRSFRTERTLKETLFELLDTNQLIFLIVDSARRWMELILDLSLSIIIFIVSLVAVHSGVNGSLTPGFVGLALVYILMLPFCLKLLIYAWPEMRSDMHSLKTLETHLKMSQDNNDGLMIPDWPPIGKIQVENLLVTPSMTGVSFLINPGEKVGIFHQNGSNLSALAQMFVRLTHVPKESIFIDDSDIYKILPTLLRLRIAIISSNDLLFSGTIRNNLDMKGSFGDEEIWSVLKTVGLKNKISKLNGGLDYELHDDSKIFTSNEIQLICLGRAIIHRPKIIITNELDVTLLKTVFDVFPTYTTIALSTEQNSLSICDRILEFEYDHTID